jgi:outer membrane receptor protein involved in Fe transport
MASARAFAALPTALAAALLAGAPARAQTPPQTTPPTYTVEVRERRPVSAASSFVKDARSFELRTMESPGEILEVSPGLMTAQHAGGGKANQYLVRGFDADHGTDHAVFVDGVPVNMRSHAHGQGFTDLHFVIPETIERIEITKGTYEAALGDFATAGSANLVTRERVPESFLRVELGEFHTQRYVALASPRSGPFAGADAKARALFAFEGYGSNGPFDHEEDFWRYSAFGRLGFTLDEATRLEGAFQLYQADWDASGQIPDRLVGQPGFDRFDSVDPSDGGDTSTERLWLRWEHELSPLSTLEAQAWFLHYDLDLYSDFTFFLNDPVDGDQIVQRDDRIAYGGALAWRRVFDDAPLPLALTAGLQTRTDDAHVRLARSVRRDLLAPISDDEVDETSAAVYGEAEVIPLPWVRLVVGLRLEHFWFTSKDRSHLARPEGAVTDWLALPKASLILRPFGPDGPASADLGALSELELFLNYGEGYHSNDARDVVANPQDVTLPAAQGWELGLRTRLAERLDLAIAYWWLNLQREFVFVGDEGVTEVNPRSRRRGVEVSTEAELLPWLFLQGDLGYSSAEFSSGGKVPQAPRLVASAGLVARHPSGFSAELRYKTLGERYGTESHEPRLRSWSVWNLQGRYRRGPVEVSVTLENLFDSDWESAEYFYASRVPGEPPEGVEDRHFVPGYPRNVRVGLSFFF